MRHIITASKNTSALLITKNHYKLRSVRVKCNICNVLDLSLKKVGGGAIAPLVQWLRRHSVSEDNQIHCFNEGQPCFTEQINDREGGKSFYY